MNNLLNQTNTIINNYKAVEKLTGEKFNLFSILGLESAENKTHSAFLGELLNSEGAHQLESVFLKHFILNCVPSITHKFDADSARLTIEKSVGKVDNDSLTPTGGRIDVYLEDKNGRTISIENKIYADDQENQVLRYVNHNPGKNTVLYLTLFGNDPSDWSSGNQKGNLKQNINNKVIGDLKSGEHFYNISYGGHIVEWLDSCMKESFDQPILRETLKQYQNLIKKLTNQSSSIIMDTEVKQLIKNNYESAAAISANIQQVELAQTELLLSEIKKELDGRFNDNNWSVWFDSDLRQSWTGLYLKYKKWDNHFNQENTDDPINHKTIRIKLEGAPKVSSSNSIYGVKVHKNSFSHTSIQELCAALDIASGSASNDHWAYYKQILDLSKADKRASLYQEESRSVIVKDVSDKLYTLAIECMELFSDLKPID